MHSQLLVKLIAASIVLIEGDLDVSINNFSHVDVGDRTAIGVNQCLNVKVIVAIVSFDYVLLSLS